MGKRGTEQPSPRRRRNGPRFVIEVASGSAGTLIRVLDTHDGTVFREVPVEEFVEYARLNSDVKGFLLGLQP